MTEGYVTIHTSMLKDYVYRALSDLQQGRFVSHKDASVRRGLLDGEGTAAYEAFVTQLERDLNNG